MFRTDVAGSASYQLREFDHPLDEQDSYALLNARLSYVTQDEKWRFVLWGKNLTDEDIMVSLFNNNSSAGVNLLTGLPEALNTGWGGAAYAEPRTFGVTATYSF